MKKRFAVKITLIAVSILMCLAMAASAADVKQELRKSSTIEKIIRSGKMRVGMSTFVPWAMQDKKGEWIGFEIDVAKQLAKDMGVKVEFVPTKWEGLIPSLLTGKFDLIIAGMTGTPT
jgi:polar amino acid transport system substrate-binding protein